MDSDDTRTTADTPPPTVLLMDERHSAATGLAECVGGAGYRVLTAASGVAALDLLIHEEVDVLVIDQAMLTRTGGELVGLARAQDGSLPVIMMQCGSLDQQQRRRFIRELELHGIHDRDGDPARLLELIESALAGVRRGARARAVEELRGCIVTKLCHDLLTSLQVIRGYSEVLRSELMTSSTQEILTRVEQASDTALGLARDYLTLARLDAASVTVRRERVDVDALLEDLRTFGTRLIGDRPLRLVIHVPSPGAAIYTDGEKLRAILGQLVANAVKFSLSGELRLAVRPALQHTDFEVVDTGPGISEHDLPGAFRPFRQLGDEAFSTTPGQGVGLAIALRLSALIGASLAAQSNEPCGTKFILSVPDNVEPQFGIFPPTLH